MKFTQLALDPAIQKAIQKCGYTQPTPVQEQSIPHVLAGKDVVACAQTGTGKTAAFVLPALNLLSQKGHAKHARILILTPTRELATQITKAASQYGQFMRYNIVSLVGGMPYERQLRDLKRGADIIVATPGRLMDHMQNHRLDLSKIDTLVLDEADRMLDMGFIEDVEYIAQQTPQSRQTLLFSATLDKNILQVVRKLLNKPEFIDLSKKNLSSPNIKQTMYRAKNMHHKSRMLRHFLNDENIYKAIIFSATKMHADRLAEELRSDGFAAAALHGDLRQNVRNRTIDKLRRGKIQFLIATDVAARGIDISDVTHVINYDLPKFCEDYVHRIGRTGRAGKSGEAISFCTSADMKHLKRIERYIGKHLNVQQDNFAHGAQTNERSDSDKYSPNAIFEQEHRGGGNGGHGRKRRRFNDDGFNNKRKPKRHRGSSNGHGNASGNSHANASGKKFAGKGSRSRKARAQ